MRTTKVMAFSVPPEFEDEIHRHARSEHRTISEYLREAVRQYMDLKEFESTQQAVSKRLKRKGRKPADVDAVISKMRKRR